MSLQPVAPLTHLKFKYWLVIPLQTSDWTSVLSYTRTLPTNTKVSVKEKAQWLFFRHVAFYMESSILYGAATRHVLPTPTVWSGTAETQVERSQQEWSQVFVQISHRGHKLYQVWSLTKSSYLPWVSCMTVWPGRPRIKCFPTTQTFCLKKMSSF